MSGFRCTGDIQITIDTDDGTKPAILHAAEGIEAENADVAADEFAAKYGVLPEYINGMAVRGRCACPCRRLLFFGDSYVSADRRYYVPEHCAIHIPKTLPLIEQLQHVVEEAG